MKASKCLMNLVVMCACLSSLTAAQAVTNVFFSGSQTATVVSSNINAVTIQSGDYRFTYSADGYWSAVPGGPPTGRFFSIYWPTGVQAQAITTGPLLGNGARITITRQDGQPFSIASFTGKLLANTAGAGASFEIMPTLNGEDAFPDPFMYQATGYYGQNFAHNTPQLTNFESYTIKLYVDFALMNLTAVDASVIAPPSLQIAATLSNSVLLTWPTNAHGFVLQQHTDLNTSNWPAVTNLVSVVGTNNQVTIAPLIGNGLFRLMHP